MKFVHVSLLLSYSPTAYAEPLVAKVAVVLVPLTVLVPVTAVFVVAKELIDCPSTGDPIKSHSEPSPTEPA